MNQICKLRQFYRYRRNLKKTRAKSPEKEEHFRKQLEFYSQFIKKDDLCFDVGANIGDKTEIFLQLGATVVAVEPQESCWRILKRRFKDNKVHIVTKALSKSIGSQEIFVDRSSTISSMSAGWIERVKKSGRFSRHRWSYRMTVETATLDALISEYGKPNFCKIDVEGFEFEVLQGLFQSIKALSFEFVSEYLELALSCIDYLANLGKVKFNYYLAESMTFALPNWVDPIEMMNIISALPRELATYGEIYTRFVDDE